MRLLIIEADEALAHFLRKSFESGGYQAEVSKGSNFGGGGPSEIHYDLALVDLDFPNSSGLELLRGIRGGHPDMPLVALASRREIEDRVKALDFGADDYLTKPFAFAELAARVRALMRRSQRTPNPVLRVEDLELYRLDRRVTRAGRRIELTPKETALLEYLMQNEGRCVSRSMIIENVWRMHSDTITNVVDVYVNYLRKKIDEGFEVSLIHTVRGEGYRLGPCEGRSTS